MSGTNHRMVKLPVTIKKLWRLTIAHVRNPMSPWQTGLLVFITALAYAYRGSSYLANPQMYAEDGVLWLAQGHNKNVFALLQPVNGFLHFPERLFGFIVAHLPLQFAPAIFVVTAWILFIFTAYYLLSSRTRIFNNNFERLFVVGALALISNVEILFFNFSNSVFLMGIIAAMIITAKKSRHRAIRIAEKVFFLLSCLTLPFAWFFLPITLFERFKYKQKDSFFLYASAFGSIVQVIYYITSHVNRSPVTLISLVSKYTLLELYNQIIIPGLRFARIDMPLDQYTHHYYPVVTVFLTVLALLFATIVVVKKTNKQTRYILFFLAGMTFASFKSPSLNAKLPVNAIIAMSYVTGAGRYFIYGVIGFNIISAKAAYEILAPRVRYAFLLIFFAFGLLTSLHYGSFYIQKNFTDYSSQYRAGISKFELSQTKSVNIPVNPYPWNMTLVKH